MAIAWLPLVIMNQVLFLQLQLKKLTSTFWQISIILLVAKDIKNQSYSQIVALFGQFFHSSIFFLVFTVFTSIWQKIGFYLSNPPKASSGGYKISSVRPWSSPERGWGCRSGAITQHSSGGARWAEGDAALYQQLPTCRLRAHTGLCYWYQMAKWCHKKIASVTHLIHHRFITNKVNSCSIPKYLFKANLNF